MITAIAYSDDRHVEVSFDATPWFEQASDEELLALAKCDFGYREPADRVALWFSAFHIGMQKLFQYLEFCPVMFKETVGFECSVDEQDAMAWMMQFKPGLFTTSSRTQTHGVKA